MRTADAEIQAPLPTHGIYVLVPNAASIPARSAYALELRSL